MKSKVDNYKEAIMHKIEMLDEKKLKEIHQIVDIFYKEFGIPSNNKENIKYSKKDFNSFVKMMDEKGSVWNCDNHPEIQSKEDTLNYVDSIRKNLRFDE